MARLKLVQEKSKARKMTPQVEQLDCQTAPPPQKQQQQRLENLHIVNSLKRTNAMRSIVVIKPEAIRTESSRRPLLLSSLFITLVIIIAPAYIPQVIQCDSITATYCPKDLSHMYPCSCQNGTQGLLVKCSRVNLAILSKSLRLLPETIEQVEIESSSISRLFGPLWSDSQQFPFHSTLRELDVRASGLQTIVAESFSRELLVNLQYLMLDRNQLQQVPSHLVNNMTNLRLLNLSSNSIGSVEQNAFIKLTNLTDLDLSENKISRLAKNCFQSLGSLEWLSLNGNELTGKLEKNIFAQVRKLKHLDLSNNKLTTLDRQDFGELTALEVLRIANNQITTLPRSIFSRNAKLFQLDLSFNKLDDIDTYLFKSTRFLKDLNVSGNLIKEITRNTFSPTTRIKRIDMSQNLLTSLAPETFKGLEWLERLDLSHNQIVNISNDAFSKIYQVEIDLSYNKLQRIFYWAFHEVSNMTKLDLSHNLIDDGISPIAFESTDCAYLDLSYNQIQDIGRMPISNLTGLRMLDLSHNQITEFNKKSFSEKKAMYELHTIDASYNNISQISGNIFERLKSLRVFNASHNSLRRLTSGAFGSSPTLLELDLSYNNLVEIVAGTLVNLISMRQLDLHHNRLKKMIPIPVALNSIHLEHNEIGQLSKAAFPSLNSLLELHLDHNRLTNIEDGTFATLIALHTLNLGYNNISTIPASALKDLTSLQNLRLSGNNIQRLGRRAFGTLPIVFQLELDHNNITTIADHAFDGMLQLLELDLSYNSLLELPPEAFGNLVSLRRLDLSSNQLNRFENKTRSAMEDLLSLEVANFSSNKLSLITTRTFLNSPYIPYKLTKLDLSNNLIGILTNHFASGLKKLEWLSLRANIINEIMPGVLANITQLRHLDLSNNKLRTLKEGTFGGSPISSVTTSGSGRTGGQEQLQELATILLNNNKLTSIVQPREFDRLRSLTHLDLSNNRLEIMFAESSRWLRRGISVDLRHNNLECSCNQLPLVAWVDNFRGRNHSYAMMSSQGNVNNNNNYLQQQQQPAAYERMARNNQLTARLLPQYQRATEMIANLTCARPDIISGKTIMQMLDLVNGGGGGGGGGGTHSAMMMSGGSGGSVIDQLQCNRDDLEEADLLKRLKAPIQYTGAEPYYSSGEQGLRIGWSLLDPQIDLTHFVLLKARLQQPFDLAPWRTSSTPFQPPQQRPIATSRGSASTLLSLLPGVNDPNFQLIEHEIVRVPYSERTLILRNLDPSQFYVVCITYELGSDSSSSSSPTSTFYSTPTAMIEQLNRTTTSGQSTHFAAIISDYSRINCASLNSLLQTDVSERLVSGSLKGQLNSPILQLATGVLSLVLSIISLATATTTSRLELCERVS